MNPVKIILIEDNPADVLLVKLALEENSIPYEIIHFESGCDAIRDVCAPEPRTSLIPDLILLDLNTPRSDGFQILATLRNCGRFDGVPIAILTSSYARADRLRAASTQTPYIEKPSDLNSFLTSVGQAILRILPESTQHSIAT